MSRKKDGAAAEGRFFEASPVAKTFIRPGKKRSNIERKPFSEGPKIGRVVVKMTREKQAPVLLTGNGPVG